jgi:hypothetical protein
MRKHASAAVGMNENAWTGMDKDGGNCNSNVICIPYYAKLVYKIP